MAVMTTACWRPYYLKETLGAWSRVRGVREISGFWIALGQSERIAEAREVIAEFSQAVQVPVHVHEDNRVGPWRAIGEMASRAFADDRTGFLITCDEDTYVADDMLEYMAWARVAFEGDDRVLLVNGHSRCGQGWDGPSVKDDRDADPSVVRLKSYFNAWGWGTWRSRWPEIIADWDWDGRNRGYDWNLHTSTMDNRLAVVPDASRSQHIGYQEGMFSTPDTLSWCRAESFAPTRPRITFRLEA
jgi:hypothetical protein